MRGLIAGVFVFITLIGSLPVHAEPLKFGTNKSEYSNDGECDDRRFFGKGMATDLDRDDIGMDARDCEKLYLAEKIQLWVLADAQAATKFSNLELGNNSSEWANDGECDDIRFEGPGTASMTSDNDTKKDANDCRNALKFGQAFLRNYK